MNTKVYSPNYGDILTPLFLAFRLSMTLSLIQFIDVFIRVLAVGQFLLLGTYLVSTKLNKQKLLAVVVIFCLASYSLLTMPIADHHYGIFRGIFLLFTEILPYALWCFGLTLINDSFDPSRWPLSVKVGLGCLCTWFVYFFAYNVGVGAFHQINHIFEFVFLSHLIYLIVREYADDLVEARRNVRIILVVLSCLYMLLLVVFEIGDASIRNSAAFSITNALTILLSTSLISYWLFKGRFNEVSLLPENEPPALAEKNIPVQFQMLDDELRKLMLEGYYTETQLTIKTLADKLATPEHQLRELINKHKGFRNFSMFLNSYRLPAACQHLADISQIRKPILTIALDLGYGSIGTFNRAFKAQFDKTPKEYRKQFQK